MREEQARFLFLKWPRPIHKAGLAGVCRETTERVDLRSHRQVLTVNRNFFGAIDKPAAKRSLSLVADDNDVGIVLRQILSR